MRLDICTFPEILICFNNIRVHLIGDISWWKINLPFPHTQNILLKKKHMNYKFLEGRNLEMWNDCLVNNPEWSVAEWRKEAPWAHRCWGMLCSLGVPCPLDGMHLSSFLYRNINSCLDDFLIKFLDFLIQGTSCP